MVRSRIGDRTARREDRALLTEGGSYVADLTDPLLEGALHIVYVRSTAAHARIRVDTSAAAVAPGVVGAFTAEDLGIGPRPSPINPQFTMQWMATDLVRWVGQPMAVIAATHYAAAVDALEFVTVDYETLPAITDATSALSADVLLYPATDTNVCAQATTGNHPFTSGTFFDGCDVVVEHEFVNQRLAACPLEVRGAAATWAPDDRLIFWTTSQLPHTVKGVLEMIYGASVRVIVPTMGGGFGPKSGLYGEGLVLPLLAKRLGRPVRWTETRSESMTNLEHGRAQLHRFEIGGSRDGRLSAYRLDVLQDVGAAVSPSAVLACALTIPMAPGPYQIERIAARARAVLTNTTPVSGYRGAGRPEATAAIERAIDLFAAAVDIDPAEVRRLNLLDDFDLPHETPTGFVYDSGAYRAALEKALAASDYELTRKQQLERRVTQSRLQLGIGVASYVEITGKSLDPNPPREYSRIEVHTDDRIVVAVGTSPHGQGHETTFATIVADRLGVTDEAIRVYVGDTDKVPEGIGTFGSRSLQQGGIAAHKICGEIIDMGRERAAELLEANVADIEFDHTIGQFHVRGTPTASVGWNEVASSGPLVVGRTVPARGPTFPFGTHVAIVEVDTETGRVELMRHVACDDAGLIVNPMLFEGQVHGGIAAGVGQALFEEVRYDEHGTPLTTNFADYGIPSAAELPSFELVTSETPTSINDLGVKGIGEAGTIGATPAVQSAVIDALSWFGVRHINMPLTPERVWLAIEEARRNSSGEQSHTNGEVVR